MDYSKVYHVGFLDIKNLSDRPMVGFSLEGNGLSVSHYPEEWTEIARLGGSNTYVLTKEDPNFFESNSENIEVALAWCVENGFLKKAKKFRAYMNDDNDEEFYMELDSEEKAQEESEDVREVSGYKFTKKGRAYWKQSFSSPINNSMAENFAIIFYAENNSYDGVWWHEELIPEQLSAPRGVIFQGQLSQWKIKKL